jgi:hypothetical protein
VVIFFKKLRVSGTSSARLRCPLIATSPHEEVQTMAPKPMERSVLFAAASATPDRRLRPENAQ